jgi:hypothetical protein
MRAATALMDRLPGTPDVAHFLTAITNERLAHVAVYPDELANPSLTILIRCLKNTSVRLFGQQPGRIHATETTPSN